MTSSSLKRLLLANPGYSKNDAIAYWSAVNDSLGGDGEGLRQQILSEDDGFGITAAVVMSSVVALLAVSPANFRPDNRYNTAASLVMYAALSVAFVLAIGCVMGAIDMRNQTGKVPARRMLEWVTTFKGTLVYEYVAHLNICILALCVATVAIAYLIHGPTAFWIFLGPGIAWNALILRNNIQVQLLLRNFLGLERPERAGAQAHRRAGAGGGADGGVRGEGDYGGKAGEAAGGSARGPVRLSASVVHPVDAGGRGRAGS